MGWGVGGREGGSQAVNVKYDSVSSAISHANRERAPPTSLDLQRDGGMAERSW